MLPVGVPWSLCVIHVTAFPKIQMIDVLAKYIVLSVRRWLGGYRGGINTWVSRFTRLEKTVHFISLDYRNEVGVSIVTAQPHGICSGETSGHFNMNER